MRSVQRVFAIKTRRGNIVRILRDQYLRDDLPCHSELCTTCTPTHSSSSSTSSSSTCSYPTNKGAIPLNLTWSSSSDDQASQGVRLRGDASHYLVLDADAWLRYLELLQLVDWSDILLLASELDDFNERSSGRQFHQLQQLIADPRRVIVTFDNEHFAATFEARRGRHDSTAARNRRALARAVAWYAQHLQLQMPVVVVLGGKDAEEAVRAMPEAPGVIYETMESYMRTWQGQSEEWRQVYEAIEEAARVREEREEARQRRMDEDGLSAVVDMDDESKRFPPHLQEAQLLAGIKSGMYLRGHLRVSRHHARDQAIVDCGETDIISSSGANLTEVYVFGERHRNRAVDGDEVVIEVLPEDQWQAPFQYISSGAARQAQLRRGGDHDDVRPTGRVVGVLMRHWRPYVAVFQEERSGSHALCIPMDMCVPKIRVRTQQAAALRNCRIVVNIDGWDRDSQYPHGHYVMTLGEIGDLETEVKAILLEQSISHPPFQPGVLAALPQRPVHTPQEEEALRRRNINPYAWDVPPEAMAGRVDLRQTHAGCVCSIDPPGCVDIDDALSVLELENGNTQYGVHIADVTHFVGHNSKLDLEARSRGTTVYLVDRRLDMLPAVLSTDLCSLRGGTDRLAFSVLWEVDKNHRTVKVWFGKTIVHNTCALSYEDAQAIVDVSPARVTRKLLEQLPTAVSNGLDVATARALHPKIAALLHMSRYLRQQRIMRGALELESFDIQFVLDQATQQPTEVVEEHDIELHHTIAEFMIHANKLVAEKIFQVFPTAALLRRHPPPQQHRFEDLRKIADTQGLDLDTSSNAALAHSLAQACGPGFDAWVGRVLKEMASRAMSEAKYFSTGERSVEEFYHYGLAADAYTHFTSPIRRYADVLAHRQLQLAIQHDGPWLRLDKPLARRELADELADAVRPILPNRNLQLVADHLNEKNRTAKMASRQSQDLFLATFLRQRELRAEAVVCSLRDNGVLVVVPRYQIKGAVLLCSDDGGLVVSPFDDDLEARVKDAIVDEGVTSLQCTLAREDDGSAVTVQPAGVEHVTLSVFDHVQVDIFLDHKARTLRSRLPRPTVRLVWSQVQSGKRKRKRKRRKAAQQQPEEHGNVRGELRDLVAALDTADAEEQPSRRQPSNTFYSVLESARQGDLPATRREPLHQRRLPRAQAAGRVSWGVLEPQPDQHT